MLGVPANNAPGGNQIYGNPRADEVNLNKLNGLGVHNGVPQHFFNQTFHKTFKSKLADKTQDGYTMVSVENGTHMGGVQWHLSNNALRAVPNAAAGGPVAGVVYQHTMSAAETWGRVSRGPDTKASLFRQTMNTDVISRWTRHKSVYTLTP